MDEYVEPEVGLDENEVSVEALQALLKNSNVEKSSSPLDFTVRPSKDNSTEGNT